MQPTFASLDPLRAIGVSGVVPSSFAPDASDSAVQIEALWGQLFSALGIQPGTPGWDFVGVTTPADDLVPPHRITYCAVVTELSTTPLPALLDEFVLDGGEYIVFGYEGPHDGLDTFYQETYMHRLPEFDVATREGQHLERYPAGGSADVMRAEAWIPITRSRASS